MKPQIKQPVKQRLRWVAQHGLTRVALLAQARRREPLARLLIGKDRAANHYRLIEQIRAAGLATPLGVGGFITADLRLSRDILRDDRFVTITPSNSVPGLIGWIMKKTESDLPNPVEPPAMVAVDPPEHTHYRKLVSQAFTPRAVRTLEDRIREVTDELLDNLEKNPHADLAADFASQLPVAIIAEMLGVPYADAPTLLRCGNHGAALLDIGLPWGAYRDASKALVVLDEYFDAHLVRLRRALRDGPTTDGILASIVRDGDLSERELKATMTLLLGAGFETTVSLIGNGIAALLRNPDQLAHLRENPDGWANAVEEVLRHDSPVQLTGRICTENVEINGCTLRPDDMIILLLGGANRDPAVFESPDVFDVTRPNAKEHIAFSSGIHVCLGATLARMEGAIALQSLFERFPELTFTGEPTRSPHVNLRGFKHLPVALGRAAVPTAT